MTSLITRQKSK